MAERFHDKVMRTFAERLKTAREAGGYEHASDFADAIGVEPHRYRHWERGTAAPDLTTLTRICQLLDVEPNDLLPLGRKRRPPQTKDGSRSAA